MDVSLFLLKNDHYFPNDIIQASFHHHKHKYLLLDNRDILKDAGKISHEIACDKALTEFEKYRVKQDKLYKSDFDLLIEEMEVK